jgi:hypothetical protein
LPAKQVWCLDALSAQHNGFWDYVGHAPHVNYHQVVDYSCSMLPDDGIDFLFSFGCFCHVPFPGIALYMANLFKKLRGGAHCFVMVGDFEKYNQALGALDRLSVYRALPKIAETALKAARRLLGSGPTLKAIPAGDGPDPNLWYHASVERTCAMLERLGYRVVQSDVGLCARDPIIHFTRPT